MQFSNDSLSLPNLFLYDKSIFHFSLNLSGVTLYADAIQPSPYFAALLMPASDDPQVPMKIGG